MFFEKTLQQTFRSVIALAIDGARIRITKNATKLLYFDSIPF